MASLITETLTGLAEMVGIHCKTKDRCITVATSVKSKIIHPMLYIVYRSFGWNGMYTNIKG